MITAPKQILYPANAIMSLSIVATSPAGRANLFDYARNGTHLEASATATVGAPASSNAAEPASVLQKLALKPLEQMLATYSAVLNGWDGPGSVGPNSEAVQGALNFLRSLSAGVKLPEVTAAGDGEISLYWRDSANFVDVSFYGSKASAYARIGSVTHKVRQIAHFHELPVSAIKALLGA